MAADFAQERKWRLKSARVLSLSRFDLKYSNGTLPHDKMMRSIELIGTKVAPRVHELLSASK